VARCGRWSRIIFSLSSRLSSRFSCLRSRKGSWQPVPRPPWADPESIGYRGIDPHPPLSTRNSRTARQFDQHQTADQDNDGADTWNHEPVCLEAHLSLPSRSCAATRRLAPKTIHAPIWTASPTLSLAIGTKIPAPIAPTRGCLVSVRGLPESFESVESG
jgi:hypothetical protein